MTQLTTAERSLGRAEAPDSSEGLKGPETGDRVAQALKASFQDLDSHILQEEEKQGVEKGAFGGCTACVAFVMGDVSVPVVLTSNCYIVQCKFCAIRDKASHTTNGEPKGAFGGCTACLT